MQIADNYLDTCAILNHYAAILSGKDASFRVHSWGASPKHLKNAVHTLPSFRIGYVLAGHGTYVEENLSSPLLKGMIFCARPGFRRQILSEHGFSTFWVHFDILGTVSSELCEQQFHHMSTTSDCIRADANDTMTAQLWRMLWTQAEQVHSPLSAGIISGLAYALLLSFTQLFGKQNNEIRLEIPRHNSSAILRQAQEFIHVNISQPLNLHDVADCLYISGRHLSRLFIEKNGITFSSYIRMQRLRKAMELLKSTDLTIEQISQECGFGSVFYFTRVFTKEIGISPGKYVRKP